VEFSGTDATAVIQSAINALTKGGKIFIKAGIYDITLLSFETDHVIIEGEGWNTVLRRAVAGDSIRPLGNFNKIKNLKLERGNIHAVGGPGTKGLEINGVEIAGGYVLTETGRSLSSYINNYIHDGAIGINIYANAQPYDSVVIANNRIEETSDDGIAVVGHGYQGRNIVVVGNVLKNCAKTAGAGIKLDKGDSWIPGITTALENVVVVGNSVYSEVMVRGVMVSKIPEYIVIKGNSFQGLFETAIWAALNRSVISDNQIHLLGAGRGIHVEFTDFGLIITGNHIRAETTLGSRGINLLGRGRRIIINGNLIQNVEFGFYEEGVAGDFGDNSLVNNSFLWVTKPVTLVDPLLAKNNIGYITERIGTATIAAGTTSVTVAHGLVGTPTVVKHCPRANLGAAWVSARDATSITLNVATAPTVATITDWEAKL